MSSSIHLPYPYSLCPSKKLLSVACWRVSNRRKLSKNYSGRCRNSRRWRLKRKGWLSSKEPPSAASKQAEFRKKWMDYQGVNGWEGLLDPLDDNLRREILRYGDFVEAAYCSFDFDPSSPTYAMCKYPRSSLLRHTGICGSGYRVTKNLYATCGLELPSCGGGWPTVKVPGWVSTRSSWIGFVAICEDGKEISRLGRRDVVIALRGTGTCLEWIENMRVNLTCMHRARGGHADGEPMVQNGFLSLFTSKSATRLSLRDTVREEVGRIMRMHGGKPLSFTLTGHSLGAALATLTAYDIHVAFEGTTPTVTVVSFGGPRVGNRSFRHRLEETGTNVLRIVNTDDPVTKVPGFITDGSLSGHCDDSAAGLVPRWLRQRLMQDSSEWLYADVGRELRLSSRECPHMCGLSMATSHDLKTYLKLVSCLVSSKCPLRATVKKMMNMHRCIQLVI
ncbi:hypothetical protein SAY86_022024 [Trapa natans]|uniref:Fungal lipase-type domain-containing protein n=1 Tax=Trapa natans TaxID=22666 RepID=A0AAN7MAX7_TRANT|nr:hypothetical protein SAY86_022024 [Trapa natans]